MTLIPDNVLKDCPVCSTRLVLCRLCKGAPAPTPSSEGTAAAPCGDCKDGLACPGCGDAGAQVGWSLKTVKQSYRANKERVNIALNVALGRDKPRRLIRPDLRPCPRDEKCVKVEGHAGECDLDKRHIFGPAEHAKSGKVNWECWTAEWHVGIEKSVSTLDGATVFRGAAESEKRGVFVRLPSALVQQIRDVVCPEELGRSE